MIEDKKNFKFKTLEIKFSPLWIPNCINKNQSIIIKNDPFSNGINFQTLYLVKNMIYKIKKLLLKLCTIKRAYKFQTFHLSLSRSGSNSIRPFDTFFAIILQAHIVKKHSEHFAYKQLANVKTIINLDNRHFFDISRVDRHSQKVYRTYLNT